MRRICFHFFGRLVGPLLVYSEVLAIHNSEVGRGLPLGIHGYIRQLLHLAEGYEWSTVLAYRVDFWSSRCVEIQRGFFDGWASVDESLRDKHRGQRTGLPARKEENSCSCNIATLFRLLTARVGKFVFLLNFVT